jgi:hypothetical protein
MLVVASNASDPNRPPGWWLNLRAHPKAQVSDARGVPPARIGLVERDPMVMYKLARGEPAGLHLLPADRD